MRKIVQVAVHSFDSLPGHVHVEVTASGGSLQVAAARAIAEAMRSPRLSHKRIGSFHASFTVSDSDGDRDTQVRGERC